MIQNVINIRLEQILVDRDKSLYALAKETGVAYNQLNKIKKNDIKGMTLDVMEKICINLDCGPGDLFEIIKSDS